MLILFHRLGLAMCNLNRTGSEEVRQEVRARGGAIIKIKFARESDGMLWNV